MLTSDPFKNMFYRILAFGTFKTPLTYELCLKMDSLNSEESDVHKSGLDENISRVTGRDSVQKGFCDLCWLLLSISSEK